MKKWLKRTGSGLMALAVLSGSGIALLPQMGGDMTVNAASANSTATSLVNNSTVSASEVTLGTKVIVSGEASGGTTPYKFAYYYKKPSASTWTPIYMENDSAYSTKTSVVFNPSDAGTYYVKVNVKDSTGKVTGKDLSVKFNAATSPLVNSSTVSASEVTLGTKVTVSGEASGGTAPYKFAYYYKKPSASTWTPIYMENDTVYSTKTSVVFNPSDAGAYYVKVNVKDSTGKVTGKDLAVKFNAAAPLVNSSTVSASEVTHGTKVTVSGEASGGKAPYKFAYYYKKPSANTWTPLYMENDSAYSTKTSVVFNPSNAGAYYVKVNVKDSTGKVTGKDLAVKFNAAAPLVNNSTVSASKVTLGTKVTISGEASGGTAPYTYAYYYKKPSASTWTPLYKENNSAYSTKTSEVFNPSDAGTYYIKINVKDSTGKVTGKDLAVDINVPASPLVNNSTVSATEVTLGTKVTVSGEASGGTAPYKFAYYYKKPSASTWTPIYMENDTAYSTKTSVVFNPSDAGAYYVKVNVKDSTGKVTGKDLAVKFNAAAPLVNSSTVSATEVTLGTKVTVSGEASGGAAPYKFAYYYKKPSANTWTPIYMENDSAYSAKTSVVFNPSDAGTYYVKVNVKDSTGKVTGKDLSVKFNAAAAPLVNSSTVSATEVTLGTKVTVSGEASGGTAPYKFAYYYKKPSASTWTPIYMENDSAYSTKTSVVFNPSDAGTYYVKVNVKDSTGKVTGKDLSVKFNDATDPLVNNSTVSESYVTLGTKIIISGKASGGTAPYTYAYYYKKPYANTWTPLYMENDSVYTTKTLVVFNPSNAGAYHVKINVKDSTGKVTGKDLGVKISVQKSVNISGKVYDPDGNVITGATIKLLDKDNTVVASTTSDAAGYSIDFLINETGDYSVKFEYDGYDPVVKSLIEVQEERVVNAMFVAAAQKVYSQYFWLDPAILSQYSSTQMIDEYGIRLDVNEDAIIKKVAIYMYQEGNTWYRSIAFVGENVTNARFMPYLAYNDVIYFDGTNTDRINIFNLKQDSDGIWSKDGSFGTAKANISDKDGNFLTVYSKNIVGKNSRIFDNKEEMKAWLLAD